MNLYHGLSRLFATAPPPETPPRRVVLILPCCIGDILQATATLQALRRGYPQAHIAWAVGGWSKQAIETHPLLDAVLDTGTAANPAASLRGMWRFARLLRAGRFDLAVSLSRSPLMSAAVWLSGIPHRVGLDSAGRGFGYTVRVPVDPDAARHEAEIYLDAARALGLETAGCHANIPVQDADAARVRALLDAQGVGARFLVVNPTGGSNPGMEMASKRWPPQHYATLIERLDRPTVLLGGPDDGAILQAVQNHLKRPVMALAGALSFGEIAALARLSVGYIGNDTGLTHLAAAAGAKTVMIFGPSDPARYAPFVSGALALWKPCDLHGQGVSAGVPSGWTWEKDGIGVDAVLEQVHTFLNRQDTPEKP